MAKGLRGIVSSPETFYKPSTQELAVRKEVAQMMGSFATLEAGKVDTGTVIPVPGQKPGKQDLPEVAVNAFIKDDTQRSPEEPSTLARESGSDHDIERMKYESLERLDEEVNREFTNRFNSESQARN